MISFGLNVGDWDLEMDNNGNINIITDDYAIAQTCANAVRLFTDEAFFDLDRGIPHFDIELGQKMIPSRIVLESRIKNACRGVEGVVDCEVGLTNDGDRVEGGEIKITTTNGTDVSLEV